ncbi:MAG: hypothetical protein ABI305_01160, partial [Tepidiformaceae bacterium]
AATTAQTFDGFHGMSLALLIAGIILAVVWLAVFGLRYVATFPKMPRAAAATNELGPEPPAVVNLLINRWKTTRTAMAATLLDLAARKILDIQQLDSDHFVVHVEQAPTDEKALTPYERQMLDFVRARATGGSAPVEALSLGEEGEATRWWKNFAKAVEKDARRLGLARGRWAGADWTILGGLLAVTLGALAVALLLAHVGAMGANTTNSTNDNFSPSDWLVIGASCWLAVMAWLRTLRGIRDTRAGQAACAHWLGVRAYLRQTKAFDELPPAAVVLWERYLAYGAALGAAHDAVHALPFEAEEPRTAWSRRTGTWRQIRIEYPRRFGFGESPRTVFLHGLVGSIFWGALAFVGVPFLATVAWRVTHDNLSTQDLNNNQLYIVLGIAAFVIVAGGYLLVRFSLSFIRLIRGGSDLGKHMTIEGPVIKLHERRVALDDGTSDEAVAWYPPVNAPRLDRGMDIRAVMSPHLHHVTSVTLLSTQGVAPPSSGLASSSSDAAAPAMTIDAATIQQITGLNLAVVEPSKADGLRQFNVPGASTAAFSDGKNLVGVVLAAATGPADTMFSALEHIPGFRGQQIQGIGDTAFWFGGNTLLARGGSTISVVHIALPGTDPARCLEIARALSVKLRGESSSSAAQG